MSEVAEKSVAVEPFKVFRVEVVRVVQLSPTFRRVTFTGPDLDQFADCGYDQRIKVVLPLPDGSVHHMPSGPDWYLRWRELPSERRNTLRTYTVRAVRPELRELDVDFVLHGDGGPASRWALAAGPGDQIAVVGPDTRYHGDHQTNDFRPPALARALLLAGDESAVPAISAILDRLPADVRGHALLEVPDEADALPVTGPWGMHVTWLARGERAHGSLLVPALREVAEKALAAARPKGKLPAELTDPDIDNELLWEVPEADAVTSGQAYAWLAGEAGVIKTLRRYLMAELGIDRSAVVFMGYWRLGRSELV